MADVASYIKQDAELSAAEEIADTLLGWAATQLDRASDKGTNTATAAYWRAQCDAYEQLTRTVPRMTADEVSDLIAALSPVVKGIVKNG